MNNKAELDKIHTALKNGRILVLKEVVAHGFTRFCINADDTNPNKDFIKAKYNQNKDLLDAGLVDEIPKDQVESHGCLSHICFSSEELKEQFINEHIFIKPNSTTFALVALNEIHEKKVEELYKKARQDKIQLAHQMIENILLNSSVSLEDLED